MTLRTILLSTIFLLFAYHSSGQIDTHKIRILTKYYNKYITDDQTDPNSSDTDTPASYVEIFEYSYPYIQTPDKDLNKFINDTIRKVAGIEGKSAPKMNWSGMVGEDKPPENYVTYKVDFISPYFLSITINRDNDAGGGANGSSHGTTALTFDLVNKKVLTTTDIFNKQAYPAAYKIFEQQFDSMAKDQVYQEKFDGRDSLSWVSNSPFALFPDKIVLYTEVSYGHGYYDGEIVYEFAKYPDLFDKKLLATIKKKGLVATKNPAK